MAFTLSFRIDLLGGGASEHLKRRPATGSPSWRDLADPRTIALLLNLSAAYGAGVSPGRTASSSPISGATQRDVIANGARGPHALQKTLVFFSSQGGMPEVSCLRGTVDQFPRRKEPSRLSRSCTTCAATPSRLCARLA